MTADTLPPLGRPCTPNAALPAPPPPLPAVRKANAALFGAFAPLFHRCILRKWSSPKGAPKPLLLMRTKSFTHEERTRHATAPATAPTRMPSTAGVSIADTWPFCCLHASKGARPQVFGSVAFKVHYCLCHSSPHSQRLRIQVPAASSHRRQRMLCRRALQGVLSAAALGRCCCQGALFPMLRCSFT